VLSNFHLIDKIKLLSNYSNNYFENIIIPYQVKNEFSKAFKEKSFPFETIKIINKELLLFKDTIKIFKDYRGLGEGELSCIYLGVENIVGKIYTDDKKARQLIKEHLEVKLSGTLGLLKEMYINGYLSEKQTINIAKQMKNNGFWINNRIFKRFVNEI